MRKDHKGKIVDYLTPEENRFLNVRLSLYRNSRENWARDTKKVFGTESSTYKMAILDVKMIDRIIDKVIDHPVP